MSLDLLTIEDAIVVALKTADLGAAWVGSIQGSFDDARRRGTILRYPALAVAYIGGPIEPSGSVYFRQMARWQVTCSTRDVRTDTAARRGEGAVGAYELVQDTLRVLSGRALDLDIGPLKPIDIQVITIDADRQVAEYAVVFESRVVFGEGDNGVPATTFTTVSVSEHPVSTDEVVLEDL